jgi:ectoine hydroxylase
MDSAPVAAAPPTPGQRFQFDTHGYLILEGFLKPDHVSRLLEALDRAVERRRRQVDEDPSLGRITLRSGRQSARLFYILDDDPMFLDLLDWAPLMPFVRALLNPDPHHCASDAILEHGADLMDRKGGWHIDGNDNGFRGLGRPIPLLQLKVGYYLTDMTRPGNANLTLVPGSHRSAAEPSRDAQMGGEPVPGALQVCAPAGTAILFHNAIWHTAAPFSSPEGRRTMLYYAYEHPWMMACEETWHYGKDFYNRRLTRAQRRFFHGLFFDPPERRQGWG